MDEKPATVLERIQLLRQELKSMNLKKTGVNAHQRYSYFELKDFLPETIDLCVKHRLTPIMQYTETMIELWVYASENEDDCCYFSIPKVSTNISECMSKEGRQLLKSSQLMGMDITYARRYLYGLFVDLVETDGFDSGAASSSDDSFM